jgi:hypothetical protein
MLRTTLSLAVALVLTGSAAASASHPVVPNIAQEQIKHRAPALAYMPTRLAIGFRYRSWAATTQALRIRFSNKPGWEITFVATPMSGSCTAGKEQSFQLAGNKVYWSHTAEKQQAWRCVVGRTGRQVRLVAASTQPPEKFAAVGLGSIVASGRRVS